jgi:imidazoleglycerol-phosphate dehydratase
MCKRESKESRATKETSITVEFSLDGEGKTSIAHPSGFLGHMLDSMCRHGGFDLILEAEGDVEVDHHHVIEDTGIVLGTALRDALGNLEGIERFGEAIVPMDESLALVALDISGREGLFFDAVFSSPKVGEFDTELVEEFFTGFVRGSRITLHVKLLRGGNSHHSIEAIFKAFGRALARAVSRGRSSGVPSTKGVIE